MGTYLQPEDLKSFNLYTLKELKKAVPDEAQRHALIGLSLRLGDYKARKELSNNFLSGRRSISFRIELATYVTQEQINILSQLSSKSPDNIIAFLEKTPLEDKIPKSEVSSALARLDLAVLGRRVETRFSNMDPARYKAYKKAPNDRDLYHLFLIEAETMIHAIAFESKR